VNTEKNILRQLGSFEQMERGTLSVIRETPNGPTCNFQRWDGARHRSEYIRADQVPVVEANLARYKEFQSLVDQYVDVVSQQSRQQRLDAGKKKRKNLTSLSPRKPRSKT
jgi:hypothetical protein